MLLFDFELKNPSAEPSIDRISININSELKYLLSSHVTCVHYNVHICIMYCILYFIYVNHYLMKSRNIHRFIFCYIILYNILLSRSEWTFPYEYRILWNNYSSPTPRLMTTQSSNRKTVSAPVPPLITC